MKHNNFMILNRVFSQNSLSDFVAGSTPSPYAVAIRRLAIDITGKTNGHIISEIYQFMNDNYRNEYLYKNTLLNKLLICNKSHSINNTTALTEIPICHSKADFILINGKAEVYEIKTELDNLERLENQIYDYYRAFDHVNVVTCADKFEAVRKMFSSSKIGIYVLDKKSRLKTIQQSQEEKAYLEHKTIFKVLRKYEYENILLSCFGKLPEVSQFDYYKECFKLFEQIEISHVYSLYLVELKKRCKIEKERFQALPDPIKSLVYFSKLNQKDLEKLTLVFDSEYRRGNVLSIP